MRWLYVLLFEANLGISLADSLHILHFNAIQHMSEFDVLQFLNIEAVVDSDEEEGFDEEQLASRLACTLRYNGDPAEVPQHFCVPTQGDPNVWLIRVKVRCKLTIEVEGLTINIVRFQEQSHLADWPTGNHGRCIPLTTYCFWYIFIEGSLPNVTSTVQGLVMVLKNTCPRLVPASQRVALLSPCNLLSHPIQEGKWVCCMFRLYHNDAGFVCGHDLTKDEETIIALVPCIPEKTRRASKCKRVGQPDLQLWTVCQLEVVWGMSQVRMISNDKYEFRHNRYKSGLVLKCLVPAGLKKMSSAPNDIDALKPGQQVKVKSGDHTGATGHIHNVIKSVATIDLGHSDVAPMLQVLLHALVPYYIKGDHIKFWWSGSHGIVMSVDKNSKKLTYVEKELQLAITTSINAVGPYSPSLNFYQFMAGTWVNFNVPGKPKRPKQQGYVKEVKSTHMLVIDEHLLGEVCSNTSVHRAGLNTSQFMVDMQELDVCTVQGPHLPKGKARHPLLGHEVVITWGPCKSYRGHIKDVKAAGAIIKLEARLTGVQKAEVAGLSSKTQVHTLLPAHDFQMQELMPEPEAGTSSQSGGQDHWLFSCWSQQFIYLRSIPFYIHPCPRSDTSLNAYQKSVARTVPLSQRNTNAWEGEVLVTMLYRTCPRQFSVNPKHLIPLEPVVDGGMVVISGPWTGTLGVVKEKRDKCWVVTFTVDGDLQDQIFKEQGLAGLD
ncbi:hypothetical protein H4582DRAFT_2052353 [Lactarius indigo]|nr:hypothetical protein H4582DRAFT_2052353 [Lactarius indigo]